jgi:hypothetical protein
MAYNTLRTTCLDSAKQRIQQALKQWDNRAKTTGITICIDGWSDAQNRPILNVLAVCPKGAMFLGAVDTSGQVKSAEYIAQVLTEYNKRRNRLTAARARDLVYVFTNGRLIEKMSNGEETFVDWEQEEEMEGGEE